MAVIAAEDGDRFRYDTVDTIPAGPVTIDLENRGKQPHDLSILRPRANVTAAQLGELLNGPVPEAAITIAQLHGGPAPVAPQSRQRVSLRLDPGEYYLASLHRGADGRIGAAHGMVRRLTVLAPSEDFARRARAPQEGAGVTVTDENIRLPDGFGVPGWYQVTVTGQKPHQLVVVKVNEGASAEDAKAWLTAVDAGPPPGPAPFSFVGGTAPLDPNRSDAIDLDLGAGTFVAYCPLPDREDGFTPAFAKGVFISFTRA